jgi:uncharacterized protein (TIRG00374 family)
MKKIKYALFLMSTLLIFFLLFYFSDPATIIKALRGIPFVAYLVIIPVYGSAWILRGMRWRGLLKSNNVRVGIIPASLVSLFGNYANFILPMRIGDLAWVYGTKKVFKAKYSVSFVTIIIDRFIDFFTVGILLIATFFYISFNTFSKQEYAYVNLMIGFLFVFFIVLSAVYVFMKEKWINKLLFWKFKLLKKPLQLIREAIQSSYQDKFLFFALFIASVIIWFLEATVPFILLRALGVNISFHVTLFSLLFANLTKIIGITPSAIGTYEAALSLALVEAGGVVFSVALTIAILDQIIKRVFILVVGTITVNKYGIHMVDFKQEINELKKFKEHFKESETSSDQTKTFSESLPTSEEP